MAAGSIGTPAGMPSTMVTSARPCDSPAVENVNTAASIAAEHHRTDGRGDYPCLLRVRNRTTTFRTKMIATSVNAAAHAF